MLVVMPPLRLVTQAFWLVVPVEVREAAGLGPARVPGSLHAAEHAAIGLLPLFAFIIVAAAAAVAGPETLFVTVIGLTGALVIALRPQWGVALIMFLLMVQYGARRYERGGVAGELASVVPVGSGLLTANNMLGVFLAVLLVYHLYRDGDWSFLKNRVLQLTVLITAVLVFSATISGVDVADQTAVGLRATSAQDPSRLLISRGLFLVLFVFFIQKPTDLRLVVGLFIALAVLTAWSGSSAALTGTGRLQATEYRAGGLDVLIQSTKNPNRLALIATLGMVFIWEYSHAHQLRRWLRWVSMAGVLLMIVTVFLTASRGGLIGLLATGLILFVRRRGSGRLLYAIGIAILGWMLVREIVPEQVMERITNIPVVSELSGGAGGPGGGSTERRKYTYGIGVDIWKTAPLVGVGPGNWPYMRFLTDPLRSAAGAHNSYLHTLAEGGLVTLALYLLLFYLTIRDLLRCERTGSILERARADGIEWMLSATRICLVAFLVFSLFADLWDLIFSYFLLGVAAVLTQRYLAAPSKVPA